MNISERRKFLQDDPPERRRETVARIALTAWSVFGIVMALLGIAYYAMLIIAYIGSMI